MRRFPIPVKSEVEVVHPILDTMSLDDAVAAMQASQQSVLVFTNALSGTVQVLQRLHDGKMTLIDPARGKARAAHGRA